MVSKHKGRNKFGIYRVIRYFFVVPILFGFSSAYAQYDNSPGNWEFFLLKGNITKRISFTGEFNMRANDFNSTYNYCEYKFSLGYSVLHNLILGAGTGGYNSSLTGSFLDTQPSQKEFRLWFEAIYKHSLGRFYIDHRVRFDWRFTNLGNKDRVRYRLALNFPVNKPQIIENTIFLSGYNELYIGQSHPSYEKNKLFLGAGYKLNRHFSFQLGNVNQNDYKGSGIKCKNYLQLILAYNI